MSTKNAKSTQTTTRSTKEPAMKKTAEKKTAPKTTAKPADKKAAKKGAAVVDSAAEKPVVSDITAAAGITAAAAIAVGEDDAAPVASDAPVDALAEEPAAVAAATTDDAPVANTDATVGACDRCGRTDVLVRAEGGLTLHDKPDGGACNFAIEPIVAAIAAALEEPPATEQPAEPDPRDMILARVRTMSPAAQRSFFESFDKKDLLLLVERATGAKTSGRLTPKGAVDRLLATLNPKPAKADKPAADVKPAKVEQPATTSTRGRAAELPAVGTVLNNVDRNGNVRASCTIVEGGVEYVGKTYTSLSAAAIVASRDLGNQTKQTSGPRFWGLLAGTPRTAKAAKGLDLDVIGRAWDRYRERAEAATKVASDEDKAKLHALLNGHTSALTDLAAAVAA